MTKSNQRLPSNESLGLIAASRRSRTRDPELAKVISEGLVSPELFNVPKELPVDWSYEKATALVAVINHANPQTVDDIHRVAAEALPEFTPERAAEIAEACIRWGARIRESESAEARERRRRLLEES